MRKKVKQVLCMFSALVVMICCAVPAFADDTVVSLTDDNISGFIISSTSQSLKKNFGSTDYAYVTSWRYRNGAYDYMLLVFDSKYKGSSIPDDELSFGSATVFSINDNSYIVNSSFNSVKPLNSQTNIRDTEGFYYKWFNDSATHIVYSNVSLEGLFDFADPNAVPAPFTVTYSPDLKLNLKRKTSDYETKSIDVTLTLNQDYLDWYIRRYAEMLGDKEVGTYDSASIKMILDSILNTLDVAKDFDLTGCGKSKCIYFISLSDPSKPLRTVTQNSVYTYLSQQRYSIVDRDNGDIDGSTSTAVYANGLYPYFTVDFNEYFKHTMQSDIASENCSYKKYQAVIKNLPTYQLSIPLENIDAEKFEVISVLNSILTCETLFPTESGQSVFDRSFKSAYSVDRGPNGVNFNNIDYINVDKWDTDDTGYLDYFSKSDCYSVYTAQFSFDSYPKYVPLKDGKGNDIDMIKTNPFDFSKSPVAPGTYQSVNKDGTLSEERTLEEQKKHDKDNTFSKNFASVDYTDFSSIFSTSSSYFEFLTASIRILPDWFIATFTAWFVTFLTLALIKYVIQ